MSSVFDLGEDTSLLVDDVEEPPLYLGLEDDREGQHFQKTPEEPPVLGGLLDDEKPTEEPPGRPGKSRRSAAKFIERVVATVGFGLVQSQRDIPVGRALQFEAPLAGKRFDAVIQGTLLDRIIQPFVRAEEGAESLGALILFPVLIGTYERNPALGPVIEPFLREAIETVAVEVAADLKAKNRKDKRTAQALADLSVAFDIPEGENVVDALLMGIFDMSAYQPQANPMGEGESSDSN
jgi:hypothetical protein